VAVLINKALIEIPPRFAGQPPINPEYRNKARPSDRWTGAKGLAEDVRHYGRWMRDEAEKRIGHLYPKARLPGGGEATVIAWLWARTVQCPNPACGCQMPLVRSWVLSSKPGKEHYVEPVINHNTPPSTVSFAVKQGKPGAREGTVGRNGAKCVACNTAVPLEYIRSEGRAGRLSAQMMAIVAEGARGRIYLEPTQEQIETAAKADPKNVPDTDLPAQALGFRTQAYGMTKHRDLFTPRQLEALTTFSDLVGEARGQVLKDAKAAGLEGEEARKYGEAIAVYLAFSVDRMSERLS
jgi:putative DNA methylase